MAIYSRKCNAVGGYSYASNFTLYVELTETDINIGNNQSKINYKVYCKSSGQGSISDVYFEYFKLNGNTIRNSNVSLNIPGPHAYIEIASGTTTAITHNSDGTKSISFEATIDANTYGVRANINGTFSLTTIPRESTVSALSADIGSDTTITINKKNSSFTHTLTYTFGDLSGIIATKTDLTNVNWTLPDSFYGQIPNAKSKIGTITCTTYHGDTSIGSSTCSFVANVAENEAKPIVTATLTDINSTTIALTGDDTKLILNASTARIVITSELRKSAGSISSVKINNVNVGTSNSITEDYSNVTTGTFTIVTTDSRGLSTTVILSPSTINYVPLTLSAQVFRPSPATGEVALTYSGNYFNGSFGSESNTLTVTYQYKLTTDSTYTTGTVDISPTISNNTYSKNTTSLGSIFTYTNAYNFIITVTDKIKSVSYSTVVSKGEPVFYWGEDFFRANTSVIAAKGLYSQGTGNVDTPVGNSNLIIKRATASEAPNNGVVLEFGNSTTWTGQLYIGDNADQGIYFNGWSNGVRGSWQRLATENQLKNSQKVLWSGVVYMNENQTATLLEKVTDQNNGIVLKFSPYINGVEQNWAFNHYFVPKQYVLDSAGSGIVVPLTTNNFGHIGTKYLYIRDTSISGHAENTNTGTASSGIKYENNYWVLRQVIGV